MIKDRDYRIFWLGQTVSWLGGWTHSLAQGWLVWTLTKSPAQLALTAVMVSLPALLFSLLGGVTADRIEKRTLLLTTQAASMVPALLLGLLTACDRITVPLILALAFIQGTINAFDIPARQAFLSELVVPSGLSRAIALNAVSFNATRMVAPFFAGVVVAGFGIAPCFFLNALSFLFAVAALLAVRGGAGGGNTPTEPRFLPLRELKEGLLFVLSEREIKRSLCLVAAISLFGIPFVPLLPVFADSLNVGAQGLGVMSAFAGSGSLIAALALSGGMREVKGGAAAAGMTFAAALLVFSRSGSYTLSLVSLLCAGAGMVCFLTLINGSIQSRCPHILRGRVMGVYAFSLLGMAPLGSALMGCLVASLGAREALSLAAALCLAILFLISLPAGTHLPTVTRNSTPQS